MAVKVTGFFESTQTGLLYDSPLLVLVPQLQYVNQIVMDVIVGGNGTITYQSIDKATLTYDPLITDPYIQLIDALDTFVINDLKDANPTNSASTFTKA